jgi:hypothetical protein
MLLRCPVIEEGIHLVTSTLGTSRFIVSWEVDIFLEE